MFFFLFNVFSLMLLLLFLCVFVVGITNSSWNFLVLNFITFYAILILKQRLLVLFWLLLQ